MARGFNGRVAGGGELLERMITEGGIDGRKREQGIKSTL